MILLDMDQGVTGGIIDYQNQWQVGPCTCFLQSKRVAREDSVTTKESLKLAKDRHRGYVGMVEVKSLTRYFSVTKGEDIRMVYNGSSSILNNSLWDPHFEMPMVQSTIQAEERGSYIMEQGMV